MFNCAQVHVQLPGCLCLLGDLDGDPLAFILASPGTAVQLVIVSCPQIEQQRVVPDQKGCERDLCEGQMLGDHCHLGVALTDGRGCKQLFGLVPMHALKIKLVRHPLDRHLHLGNFGVVEGLSVSGPRRPAGSGIFKEHQNPLHAARGDVEIDVSQGVTFVLGNFAVAEDPDEQLLVLVYCRWVIRDHDRLTNALDSERVTQYVVWVEFLAKLRSHVRTTIVLNRPLQSFNTAMSPHTTLTKRPTSQMTQLGPST